ncbi:MAG: hypothetical protein H6Q99_2723 [Proteobacteria bacterium]|nr:hypothetical protein [Pseudomonadota bacterium]
MATAHSVFAGKTAHLSALFGTTARPAGGKGTPRRTVHSSRTEDTPVRLNAPHAPTPVAGRTPDAFDRAVKPIRFTTGEAAIAVGWSYIDDLESCLSAVNTAMSAHNSNSAEIARRHFGDDIGDGVRKYYQTQLENAEYRLDDRLSSISRAFTISGSLLRTDDNGQLALGWFTLSYQGDDFRATVDTDQLAWITRNGAARPMSVRQVVADLASGKLPL